MSLIGSLVSRNCSTEVREITLSALTFESWVRMSSWMPSTKNASSAFALRLSNGSTAIEGPASAGIVAWVKSRRWP